MHQWGHPDVRENANGIEAWMALGPGIALFFITGFYDFRVTCYLLINNC